MHTNLNKKNYIKLTSILAPEDSLISLILQPPFPIIRPTNPFGTRSSPGLSSTGSGSSSHSSPLDGTDSSLKLLLGHTVLAEFPLENLN